MIRPVFLAALCLSTACAQSFTQRGFLESRGIFYPQAAPNDSGHAVNDWLLRYEASKALFTNLRISGAFDARTDSHRQTERRPRLNLTDRGRERPALSLRRLSAVYNRGKWTMEAGKQLIRWGKADILNPTDRFAPRDFLSVVDSEFLAVTAARVTFESDKNSVDLVWQPVFTPSRTPLLNQRWAVLPPEAARFQIRDAGARLPGGSQFGVRLNRVEPGYEASVSFFEGRHHLPFFEGGLAAAFQPVVNLRRVYPRLRMYGGDAAVPFPWFTIKTESAWFTTTSQNADEYILYVIQLERQTGEWSVIGGYAGEVITQKNNPFAFAPDRGLTRAFLGRAGYTIDANRSFAFEGAVRQNGDGVWLRSEYSHAFGQNWRATAGLTVIRGNSTDFLGQYRRNSHATFVIRYSF